jgi:hypothetical protein
VSKPAVQFDVVHRLSVGERRRTKGEFITWLRA